MKKALRLAQRGAGRTSPNPCVGAVVVKNAKVVGKGFHKKAGLPHAEILALKKAGNRAKGANLYVTLEPCNHLGKTPPCTNALIKSGIKRVIIGMRDPNPVNNGKGLRKLKQKGINIKEGVLKKQAEGLNKPFIKFITKKMPYVTVKVAQSLDGKIATSSGDSKWITNSDSRRYVHWLRSRVDAVLVGINTVLTDDPLLTPRLSGIPEKQTKRIVIDTCLRIPFKARLLKEPRSVIIATTRKAPKERLEYLKKKKVDVIITNSSAGGIDLKYLLRHLAMRDIVHILVEGGGKTVSSFLKEGLVDEMLFFISARIIGGENAITSVEGEGVKSIDQATRLRDITITRFGRDFLIRGNVYRNS